MTPTVSAVRTDTNDVADTGSIEVSTELYVDGHAVQTTQQLEIRDPGRPDEVVGRCGCGVS